MSDRDAKKGTIFCIKQEVQMETLKDMMKMDNRCPDCGALLNEQNSCGNCGYELEAQVQSACLINLWKPCLGLDSMLLDEPRAA